MNKVGILTFFRPLNYGAVLQAYALSTFIKNRFGYDVELIDFRVPRVEYCRKLFRPKEYVELVGQPKQLVKRIGADLVYAKTNKRRKCHFDSFIERYLNVSKETYWSEEDLKQKARVYDVYISGSDLVWNPEMAEGVNSVFFHSYVTDNTKIKLSYAASVGVTSLPESVLENYAKWMLNLDYVSVRERSSVDLLQSICRKTIENVLDPVLLTTEEDWAELIKGGKIIKQKYVLAFMLEYSRVLIETVKEIAAENNCQIITLDQRNYYKDSNVSLEWEADPETFLSLVKNASYVVTNSFHGCAFSLIFHKELWCIPHTTRGIRMTELLSTLDLQSRIVGKDWTYSETEIEYELVEEKLSPLRARSVDFLIKALGEKG